MRAPSPAAIAVAAVVALVAVVGSIGADARWLVAMGRFVVEDGSVPDSVPYAAAASSGWHNVPVLAEVAFYGLQAAFGDHGLLLAQLAAVTAAFTILAVGNLRSGVGHAATAVSLLLVGAASLAPLAVVRVQLFSLVLFPLLLLLLRMETRAPSRTIWVAVPLFALWSNLHGAALVGIAVLGAYLLLERARSRPLEAAAVLLASGIALLATPALLGTANYYAGVLENEAAARGVGLWAPLSLASPFDLVFLAAVLPLAVLALRSRPPLWELGALAGLLLLTIQSARGGVWLAFMLALPAGAGLRRIRDRSLRFGTPLLAMAAVIAVAAFVRGPLPVGLSDDMVERTLREAAGTPVLAEPIAAEQLAAAGGIVWLANPLDAFSPADQRLYLDWLEGEAAGDAALTRVPRLILVDRESPAGRRARARGRFTPLASDDRAVLYARK